MDNLLALLPPLRRIRGARLYTADGKRFLDLWLDDGRGILGEKDRRARLAAANAADKGLVRPYPGLYDRRLANALAQTWPAWPVARVYASEARMLEVAERLPGYTPAPVTIRPFDPSPVDADVVTPRLPCPSTWSPWCLLARSGTPAGAALSATAGDILPAAVPLAAATALHALAAAARDGYDERHWAGVERRLGPWFARRGPWLYPRVPASRHEAFFRAALEGSALVAPVPGSPCVVPPDVDDGELVRLTRSLEASFPAAEAPWAP